jgi:transcriptional regulator with XRE-family HTH domain
MGTNTSAALSGSARDISGPLRNLKQRITEVVQSAQELTELYSKNAAVHESLLFLQKALVCVSEDAEEFWLDSSVKIDWQNLGKRLKRKRMQAKLGQKELADLVDISEAMIRAIEGGQRRPSRAVLLRLLAAPSLGLRLEDIATEAANDGVVPTSWLAPHYDPSQMITAMVEQLNSTGGSLEQTTAYLDYQSAKDWLDICSSPSYLDAFSNTSALEQVARRIAAESGAGGLDVIALGSGDAKSEVKLVEYLLQHGHAHGVQDIRLFLLDISHSLLTVGHANAREALGGSLKSILALHGNFHDLPKYPLFSERDVRTRTRVFTMLGCTLANLDNEVRFFRDTMSSAAKGDFFIADFTNVYASADDPEQIRAVDPHYLSGIRSGYKTWLGGPLHRYQKGLADLAFSMDINTDCSVRGSYELTYVAHVTIQATPSRRRFAIFRVKRYDVEKLEECLSRSGWHAQERLPYGANDRSNITLTLLKRD